MVRAAIFDLDGTLTDTLQDIAASMNWALEKNGLPGYAPEKYKYMVGNGAKVLAERVTAGHPEQKDAVLADYLARYGRFKFDLTRPYDGIPDMLAALKAAGLKLAVLSNKPHNDTAAVIAHYFPAGTFDLVYGAREGVPIKPDPTAALALAQELGVAPAECLYFGDTDVDMHTANNAGMIAVGVEWGFRTAAELQATGAAHLLQHPAQAQALLAAHESSI